jgi:hypothetical protein
MPYFLISVVLLAIVLLVGRSIQSFVRYYRKIYSDEHHVQISQWVAKVLQMGPIERPSLEDGSAIITDAKIVLAFTHDIDDEYDTIHFSISQRPRHTTHAVGGRMIFFLIQLLRTNKSNADCFYSSSTVHHLVLQKEKGEAWTLSPVEEAIARMEHYEPLPMELRDIPPPE